MPAESKWEGVKEATSYGFVCPLMSQETPNGELLVPHRYWPMDEHCQNLNIWTDTLDENAKKARGNLASMEAAILPVPPLSRKPTTASTCAHRAESLWSP